MSWGCAVQVREPVLQHAGAALGQVAVLGAGVMGLTAAKLLVEAGFTVRMYATSFLYTTSDVAGGQWAPSFVDHVNTPAARQRFETSCARPSPCTATGSARAMASPNESTTPNTRGKRRASARCRRRHPGTDRIRPSAFRAPESEGLRVSHPAGRTADLPREAADRTDRRRGCADPADLCDGRRCRAVARADRRQLHRHGFTGHLQ